MLTLDTQNLRMIVFLLLSAFGFATCVIALSVYYEVNNPGADSTALMLTLLLVPILLATAILLPGLSLVLFAIAGRFDLEPLMSDWTDVAFWIAASLLLVLPVYVQRYRLSVVIRHPIAVAFAVFTIVLSVSAIGMQGYEYPLEKTYRVLLLCSLLFLLPLFVIRKQSDVTRFFAALVAVATTMGLVSLGLALQGSSLPDIQRLAPPGGAPFPLPGHWG